MLRFPNVQGSNLEGRRFNLPRDFEGETNLVLIAFEQWHQPIVDTWMPFTQALMAEFPGVRRYELPTIQKMGWFNERMLDYWMRVGIPDVNTRRTTITLYLDVAPFCQALELPTSGQIYALLVNRDGEVLWRAGGGFTPALGDEIKGMLRQPQGLV